MFIAALFTITKLWKQPRCPTTEGWIKKMQYLYTMDFNSVTKKNEILSCASKWMELENITLTKIVRVKRPRISYSSSYADYRLKTNTVILLDMGHTLRGDLTREKYRKGRKPKTRM
jgi:hypothetical protein